MNLHITDFPEYPWKTLDVHKDFSYSFNISPGKKIEEDLFDSSKMKVVSYNENSHVQILAVCDPYNSSLKFEIKAKQFYAASQRVL